ncbi:MAG: hypothetical protein R3F19_01125 [Verrucomicrobiales bacterium]
MDGEYYESGGLRWGSSYWLSANATFPFGKIWIDDEKIVIEVDLLVKKRRFDFPKEAIQRLAMKRALMGKGLVIQHSVEDYPRFVLFWTFSFPRLKSNLEQRGYTVD